MRSRTQNSHLSLSQDVKNRRNPRLVPYIFLDERTKKSNKDSLKEAVRTLLGYGYNLEAPDHDHGIVFAILPLNIVSFLERNQIAYHLPDIPCFSSISIRPKQDVCWAVSHFQSRKDLRCSCRKVVLWADGKKLEFPDFWVLTHLCHLLSLSILYKKKRKII